jgi:hypothetical protein
MTSQSIPHPFRSIGDAAAKVIAEAGRAQRQRQEQVSPVPNRSSAPLSTNPETA